MRWFLEDLLSALEVMWWYFCGVFMAAVVGAVVGGALALSYLALSWLFEMVATVVG